MISFTHSVTLPYPRPALQVLQIPYLSAAAVAHFDGDSQVMVFPPQNNVKDDNDAHSSAIYIHTNVH